MKLRSSALALAAASLLLAACGGGSDVAKAKKPEAGPSLSDAEAVVLDYFAKAFAGDAAACEHESARYSAAQDELNGTESCTERIEAVQAMLTDGEPLLDVSKSVVEMREGEDGGAVAEVTHEFEGFGGTYLLVVEDGTWVIDGEEASDEAGDAPGGARTVTEEEAEAAALAFCKVEVGVTRKDVVSWLGEPTEETTDEDGQPELTWSLNQDMYTVWLDEDDKVAYSSGSSPREGDPCAS